MAQKQTIDAMWDDSPIDVSTEVNFIWSIANKLRGTYQSDKYKDVIIPMVIIRRFECALEPTKDKVVAQFKANPNYPAKAMYRISGFQFYNTSEFTLAELINDADHLAANFKAYLQSFSPNVQEIIVSAEKGLDFYKQIDKMDKNNRLLSVVKAFSELDLNPRTIDNVKMGYIFEDLIRRFSENAEAGDHYTGRDIIKLMVNILLAEGCDDIFDDGKVITVLDQACGTGGMLSTSYNFIKRYNPTADVRLFGQEINPESYAICLAEMLIKGQNAENICYQDTMKKDRFEGTKMRFVIENPPFGTPWGGKDAAEGVEKAVNDEYVKGFDGRWGAGLPGSGDMQMLFLQSAIDKMDDNFGRAAIIENGSPLFSGGTALINNIYHMLSYAFQALNQETYEDVAVESFDEMYNLLAAILSKGIGLQLKQGLYREYISRQEELSVMRGKINMPGTIKNRLAHKRVLTCDFDELSENNLLNQILKTTVTLLLRNGKVQAKYKDDLKKKMLYFSNVEIIEPTGIKWSSIRFQRNNQTYRMLVSICQLIIEGMLITTDSGDYRLASFVDEQRMCRLYEKFILEYYSRHYPELSVSASQIPWSLDDGIGTMLPVMQSDIHLQRGNTVLIIDAKYYSHTTQSQFDKHTIHSNNLYQIFTYVKNRSYQFGEEKNTVSGMLLYAKTEEEIQPDNVYQMHGSQISVKTLDLNQPFAEIANQMDRIVESHFSGLIKTY